MSDDNTLLTAYRVNASGHYISGTGQDLGTHANDAARVFTVALDDDNSGSYSFTLRDNIDHQPGHGENTTELNFTFIATDSDGDTATAAFSVSVVDDVPVIGHPDSKSVNEDDLSDGNDPAPQAVAAFEGDVTRHRARLLLYNTQTVSPLAAHMRDLALKNHIPVVGVSETEPPGQDYQQWQLSQLHAIDHALSTGR